MQCTEVRFASFLSGGFTANYGSNQSTGKETGKTQICAVCSILPIFCPVHWYLNFSIFLPKFCSRLQGSGIKFRIQVLKRITEGSCLMLLLGPGKSPISQKLHQQNFYFMFAVTKQIAHKIALAKF